MRPVLLKALLIPALALAADSLVGDWSTDAESGSSARVSSTADGRHEGVSFENSAWLVLATGTYRLGIGSSNALFGQSSG